MARRPGTYPKGDLGYAQLRGIARQGVGRSPRHLWARALFGSGVRVRGLCLPHRGEKPHLELYLADLPEVLQVAREVQSRYAPQNKVQYIPCDVLTDEVPGRYDIILISNMLQALGTSRGRVLIKRLWEAVRPGGSLVVQAQFLDENRMGPRWSAVNDLILLCGGSQDCNQTRKETRGFRMSRKSACRYSIPMAW